MNQLIVADNATYAAKTGGGTVADITEAHLLEDGAIAIFGEDGALITGATVPATIANQKQFTVVANSALNGLWKSIPIDRDAFFRGYCAYVAPVKQVRAVGYNGGSGSMNFPVAIVAGDEVELSIGIYQEGRQPAIQWHRANYTVKNGDTAATIVTALIAQINAIPNSPVTATVILQAGTPAGISLAAVDYDTPIEIRLGGIIVDATVSTTTALVYGKGTATQVAAAERRSWLEDGDDNRLHLTAAYWGIESDVDQTQYDLFSIQWQTERKNAVNSDVVATPMLTLAIGNTALRATINTILTTVLLISIPNTGSGSSNSQI